MFASTQARAAEGEARATLSYAAPAQCPEESSFRRRVAARLGYDPFVPAAERGVAIEMKLQSARVKARARFSTPGRAAAERTLEDTLEHCDSLTDALASAVAMAVDPARASAPAPLNLPEPVRPPAPPVTAPTPPQVIVVHDAPVAPPGPPVRFFAQTAVGAGFGVLPGDAITAEAGFGARYVDFSLAIEGRVDQQPGTATLLSGLHIDATALSAALVPCGRYGVLAACAVGRWGTMQGHSPDVAAPTLGSSQLASASLRAELQLPLGKSFALRALGEAGLPLVRTSFVVDGRQTWTAPGGIFALGAGVNVGF